MRLLKKCKTLRAALGGRLARMGRRGRWELSVLLGLALALSLSSFTRFSAACAGVREDTLRLHILANSDSEADQELKLAVRDAILQAEGGMFAAERTKEGALRAAGAPGATTPCGWRSARMPGKTGSACCFRPCAFPRQHPTAGRTCRLIPVRSSRLCAVLIRSALRLWNGWRG